MQLFSNKPDPVYLDIVFVYLYLLLWLLFLCICIFGYCICVPFECLAQIYLQIQQIAGQRWALSLREQCFNRVRSSWNASVITGDPLLANCQSSLIHGLGHSWRICGIIFIALSLTWCEVEGWLYARPLYVPVWESLYPLSIKTCLRYEPPHPPSTHVFFNLDLMHLPKNISPNKFWSDIFSNPKTSQSPCRERGLSDQWRMRPLLSIQTSHDQTHSTIQIPQSVFQLRERVWIELHLQERRPVQTHTHPYITYYSTLHKPTFSADSALVLFQAY